MVSTNIDEIVSIEDMVRKYPNDSELGEKIREHFTTKEIFKIKAKVINKQSSNNKDDRFLTLFNWEAFVDNENCIRININESLNITDSKIKFLGKDQEFLLELKLNSRNITIYLPITNPLFVELHTLQGVSVQYVKGTGKDHFNKIKKENNNFSGDL